MTVGSRLLVKLTLASLGLLTAAPSQPGEQEVRVRLGYANIRREPTFRVPGLFQVYRGEILKVVSRSGDWYLVSVTGRGEGYINAVQVEPVVSPVAPPPRQLAAPPLPARGMKIDHKRLGCIVAERYPKVDACFVPGSNVTRAQIHFRGSATDPWFAVSMEPEGPCYSAYLPQPSRTTPQIQYYVDVIDRRFAETMKPDTGPDGPYRVRVVKRKRDCERTELIAAAIPTTAEPIVVGIAKDPAGRSLEDAAIRMLEPWIILTGFSTKGVIVGSTGAAPESAAAAPRSGAGSGTLLIAGAVGGGAAVAGAVVAFNLDGQATPTTVAARTTPATSVTPGTTLPPITTTTTTIVPSAANKPPNASFRVNPDPPTGRSPLSVAFNMCQSTDPENDPLQFSFSFGDGRTDRGPCRTDHIYTVASVHAYTTFDARICVTDGIEGHERCKRYGVDVSPPGTPDPCRGDTASPSVAITGPPSAFPSPQPFPMALRASASDPAGILKVKYSAVFGGLPPVDIGESSMAPYAVDLTLAQAVMLFGCPEDGLFTFVATALDTCKNLGLSKPVQYRISGLCFASRTAASWTSRLIWTSDLDVPEGQGQVVLNGSTAFFPKAGRSMTVAEPRPGENRIEAVLVDGKGRSGTWRFEFASGTLRPDSLRVVAGEAVLVAGEAIVFQLRGTAGERLVFSFRTRR